MSSSKPSGTSSSRPSGTSSSKPSGASSSKPGSASSFRLRGNSSWNPSARFGSVNPNETFLSRAEETTYGSVLEERMRFDIFVHKGHSAGDLHHSIVVSNTKHDFVTLELCTDPATRSKIIPMCQQFQGKVKDLKWKKTVECTFKELAEEAMNIWYKMGSYNLIGSNCQDFCNYFLECMDAPQYLTTVEKAAIGATGAFGTTLLIGTGFAVALLAIFARR